jgi:hypothetical protein
VIQGAAKPLKASDTGIWRCGWSSGTARRVWVFDRGIVSDANLAAIRRRGGQYLMGTRRSALKQVERVLLKGT